MPEITNWTSLLVALSPLLVAWIRRDSWGGNLVAALSLGTVGVVFFLGRWIDGALIWPLPPEMAVQLGVAIAGQQVIYQIIRKTSLIQSLESR